MLIAVACITLCCLSSCFKASYPTTLNDDNSPTIYRDSLASDKKKDVIKPKKLPKRMFYGIMTKKAFTKTLKQRNQTFELFFVLKKPLEPDPYVPNIYWFHIKKKKIFVGAIPIKEKAFAKLLHGPYRRVYNRKLVEEGQFYVGTKTGRWETYGNTEDQILADKKKYIKGWLKESAISYYDAERKKVKEVIPIESGKENGDYFKFYASGAIESTGKYENGEKIGIWKDFYEPKRRLKKSTQYAENGYVKNFTPFVINEVAPDGTVTYDKEEEDKKKAKELKK